MVEYATYEFLDLLSLLGSVEVGSRPEERIACLLASLAAEHEVNRREHPIPPEVGGYRGATRARPPASRGTPPAAASTVAPSRGRR